MARYKIISCHVLWREVSHFASLSANIFDFQFLKQGLHNTPDLLRSELQAAIDATEPRYDALLIGYGLCSNGIANVVARQIPLVVVRGHDCITHLLGSRQRYKEYFASHPGTYWYSPGWNDTGSQPGQGRYERLLAGYEKQFGKKNAAYLMEMEQGWFKSYSNAVYVDLGFGPSEAGKAYTKECADWLKWNYEALEGDPSLVQRWLAGEWQSDDFLFVQPGQRIVPSYDDLVIKAEVVSEANVAVPAGGSPAANSIPS